MDPKNDEVDDTWGLRFFCEAKRQLEQWFPLVPWVHELAPLLGRMTALTVADKTRYQRLDNVSPMRNVASPPALNAEEDGLSLPPAVRGPLLTPGDPRLENVRVHTDYRADVVARSHRADAVTIGQDIYFRSGEYRPSEPSGLALLAHEVEHVLAALRPNAAWRRSTTTSLQEEEERARARETQLLSTLAPLSLRVTPDAAVFSDASIPVATASHNNASSAAVPTVNRPMAAKSDRGLGAPAPVQAPEQTDVEMLRRDLYRDLLGQIRADMERGA